MKSCYASLLGLAIMAVSCSKESQHKTPKIDLAAEKSKLTYINEVIFTDSISTVNIPIDSNTAIVHAHGDTTFPLWYLKQLAAVNESNARQIGDANEYGTIIQENDNFNAPVKAADGSGFDYTYSVPEAHDSITFFTYQNGEVVSYNGTYPGSHSAYSYNFKFRGLARSTYYTDMEARTFDANGNRVALMNRRHFYAYGWQTVNGLGTAYGADMKYAQIDSNPKPDFVGMISNRTSQNINGISYKVFKNVSKDGIASSETSVVTKLLYPTTASSLAPLGGAVAVAKINNNNIPDFIFVTFTSMSSPTLYQYRYIIAYDINENGQPASWSDVFVVNGPHSNYELVKEIGAAVIDINNDGMNDLVLTAMIQNGDHSAAMDIHIGFSINASGSAAFSDNPGDFNSTFTTKATTIKGGGIGFGHITDKPNGNPLVMVGSFYAISSNGALPYFANVPVIFNPEDPITTMPRTGQDWTLPTVGDAATGGGVDIADIDGNGTLDCLNMAYVGNVFRFYINYDMNMHYYNTTTYDNYGIPYFKLGMNTSHTN